ncbi:outer membrane protein assembly factor BamE [Halosquirtibacter xylanolyticus]|uniref:hypothetical protein n=1 Tax=Halosquirtibacter xylanolyticus TaxID=3374599 RepID=UPI003749B300|nr:outer membrane protein assembly factor BamE [Prolixibacteraceae bacterium]
MSRKVSKELDGLTVKQVMAHYGKPAMKYLDRDSCWVYVFDKSKRLKSQPISGGNFHATQMKISSTTRTDHYYVEFDENQRVKNVRIKSDYN